MARRGTSKALSVEHENFIARLYRGTRSASSGGADNDAGDVRLVLEGHLFECKMTGVPGEDPKPKPKFLKELEKVAEEAYTEGREPALALRFYQPDSILSDRNGWVDLTVRVSRDDAERTKRFHEDQDQ